MPKRKYTFRKGEIIPYPSGGIIHEAVKTQREMAKNLESAFGEPRKTRRKQSIF
jgi:hypothetical protein